MTWLSPRITVPTHVTLWRESLYSDGQQCHQYQQNEQSTLTLWTKKGGRETMKYDVGNPDPGLGHSQKSGRVKPVYWIPTLKLPSYVFFIAS